MVAEREQFAPQDQNEVPLPARSTVSIPLGGPLMAGARRRPSHRRLGNTGELGAAPQHLVGVATANHVDSPADR